jgi:aldehyde dehydrogenase (NAD+)
LRTLLDRDRGESADALYTDLHRARTDTDEAEVTFTIREIDHLELDGLPTGGVGDSGSGSYHGPYSIASFSHRKALLDAPIG